MANPESFVTCTAEAADLVALVAKREPHELLRNEAAQKGAALKRRYVADFEAVQAAYAQSQRRARK